MEHFAAHGSPEHLRNLSEYTRGLEAELRRLGGDPGRLEFADGQVVVDSFGRRFEADGWSLLDVLKTCATVEGEHHRQYAIDQALRALLGAKEYAAWRAEQGDEYNAGVAP